MRRNTKPTLISAARNAITSKPFHCSIEREQERHADGLGIATASNVGVRLVLYMGHLIVTIEMRDSALGGSIIPEQPARKIKKPDSIAVMDLLRSTWKRCENNKKGVAQFVSAKPQGYLSIIAIRLGVCVPSSVKRAIRSLVGTNEKREQSYGSRHISTYIRKLDQPCHADVLLEIANA